MYSGSISDFSGTIDIEGTVFSGQTFLWMRANDSQSSVYTFVPYYHSPTGKTERVQMWNPKKTNKTDFTSINWEASFEASTYIKRRCNLTETYFQMDKSVKNSLNIDCPSIRILSEPFWPTVVSFICSSAANIERIYEMQQNLLELSSSPNLYPTVETLSDVSTEKLQNAKLGYRAKYVSETASSFDTTQSMLETYNSLIGKSVSDVKETLKTYSGVGDKVADCISLYSLNNLSVVPVDTHIEDTSENPEEFFAELSGADKSGIAQLYIFADQSNAQERM